MKEHTINSTSMNYRILVETNVGKILTKYKSFQVKTKHMSYYFFVSIFFPKKKYLQIFLSLNCWNY